MRAREAWNKQEPWLNFKIKDMKTRTWNRTQNRPYRFPLRAAPDALTKHPTQTVQEGGGAEVGLGRDGGPGPWRGTGPGAWSNGGAAASATVTMNPAVSRLLCLRQGDRAIEDYVKDFCGLCHLVDFNDVALKDICRVGLNEPIRLRLPGGKIKLHLGSHYARLQWTPYISTIDLKHWHYQMRTKFELNWSIVFCRATLHLKLNLFLFLTVSYNNVKLHYLWFCWSAI